MLSEIRRKARKSIEAFHREENGDWVQNLLWIFVAAVVIFLIYKYVLDKLLPGVKNWIDKILGLTSS